MSKKRGRFFLRVTSSEASGPPGSTSTAMANAKVPRPPSGIRLNVPRSRDSLLHDATKAVVENLGLIWPDEAEAVHEEVAQAVLREVALARHSDSCRAWPGPKCICSVSKGMPDDY